MKTDRINIRVKLSTLAEHLLLDSVEYANFVKGEIEKAAGQMGLSVSAYLIMLHKMQKNGVQLHGGGGYERNH